MPPRRQRRTPLPAKQPGRVIKVRDADHWQQLLQKNGGKPIVLVWTQEDAASQRLRAYLSTKAREPASLKFTFADARKEALQDMAKAHGLSSTALVVQIWKEGELAEQMELKSSYDLEAVLDRHAVRKESGRRWPGNALAIGILGLGVVAAGVLGIRHLQQNNSYESVVARLQQTQKDIREIQRSRSTAKMKRKADQKRLQHRLEQLKVVEQDLEKRLERLKPSKPIAAPLSARRFMNESDSDED